MRVLCAVGWQLSVTRWLVLPPLFVAAALGVVSLPSLLLDGKVELFGPLFGAGLAVGLSYSFNVRWRASWQRYWLRWPYLVAFGFGGIAADGLVVPAVATAVTGLPALGALVLLLRSLRTMNVTCPVRLAQNTTRPEAPSRP